MCVYPATQYLYTKHYTAILVCQDHLRLFFTQGRQNGSMHVNCGDGFWVRHIKLQKTILIAVGRGVGGVGGSGE